MSEYIWKTRTRFGQ